MKLIIEKAQLLRNIETVENYLTDGSEEEQEIIKKLIRKGKSIVAYKADGEIRFAPSRFLGYVNNNLKKHKSESDQIDGKETNPVLTKVIGSKLIANSILESNYKKYCKNLGVTPSNYSKRRYWLFELDEDFIENKELDGKFPEGKIAERIHKSRERSSKVVTIAKNNFKLKHGHLFCQICKFDFEKKYGKIGTGYIEAHHTIYVSDMKPNHMTSPDEIAMLCANCHRMVHKKRPWLTMKKLNSLLK